MSDTVQKVRSWMYSLELFNMTDTVIKVENLSKLYRLGEAPLRYISALLCRSGYAKAMRAKPAPFSKTLILGN